MFRGLSFLGLGCLLTSPAVVGHQSSRVASLVSREHIRLTSYSLAGSLTSLYSLATLLLTTNSWSTGLLLSLCRVYLHAPTWCLQCSPCHLQGVVSCGSCSVPWQWLGALQIACRSTRLCWKIHAVPAACVTLEPAVSYMPTLDHDGIICSEVWVLGSFSAPQHGAYVTGTSTRGLSR